MGVTEAIEVVIEVVGVISGAAEVGTVVRWWWWWGRPW